MCDDPCVNVDGDEVLYRAIQSGVNLARIEEGMCVHSSASFSDRNARPSVDRAVKLASPEAAKFCDSDGVLQVKAAAVIALSDVTKFAYEVCDDPRPDRPAHALIRIGGISNRSQKARAIEEIAKISSFVICPDPCE